MTPLTITFTTEMPDAILERGATLTAARTAAEAFKDAMTKDGHKTSYAVTEAVAKVRKARTVHPVAEVAGRSPSVLKAAE